MSTSKSQVSESPARSGLPSHPRLVKATEFAARREAAAEAARARAEQQAQPRPALKRAPRGEAEARQMFDMLFEAA